jgi:NCS2 family nucleobase:cation symporter-2/xanthine permease XanP
MSGQGGKLLYDVNERPPLWLILIMGIQHVMLIYGEITILPVIIGKKAGVPMEHILFASLAAGVASGVITLVQVIRFGWFGSGYAMFMGSSAAYLSCSLEILKVGGFSLLGTLSILVAPIEIIMAYFLRFLRHIITPAVGGVILFLVVLSLIPVSISEWVGETGHAFSGSWENLLTGFVTLWILLGVSLFGKRSLRVWAPILGMAAGLIISWYFDLFHDQDLSIYPWIGWFQGKWPGLVYDLKMDHLPLMTVLAVLTVINGVQAIGNSMALQQVSHREHRAIDYGVVQGTLYGDALGNMISGTLGTIPNETYSENISIQKITGVASRSVGICGGLMLIALPFMPKISMFLVHLPTPVFGGFLMGLAAMMFPSGFELVFSHGMTHRSGLLVGISLCIGVIAGSGRFFPGLFPDALAVFLNNPVAAGGLTAVSLSVLFRIQEKRGFSALISPGLENLPILANRIQECADKLDISREHIRNLHLACEEIFVHFSRAETSKDTAKAVVLRISNRDDELFVEIIYGRRMEDIREIRMPTDMMTAEETDLDRLGLALLHRIVHDFHQVIISGTTYVWFKI